ncbi:MAG: DUF3102 domain-containing protein [Planctomycetes bacterium]|nr:DUF3102 domain-containing protein [Planctomycetota bacterium]
MTTAIAESTNERENRLAVEKMQRRADRRQKVAPLAVEIEESLVERFNGTKDAGGNIDCNCPYCGMVGRAFWSTISMNLKCPACSRRLSDAKCAEHIKSMGKKMPATKSFYGYRELANRLKVGDVKLSPLDRHAEAIRSIQRRMAIDLIEIGKHLVAAKKRLDHGAFTPWLDREFNWSDRTARLFMQVFETFGKTDNFSDLEIGQSALYLLSAESTPEDAKADAIDRAKAGEKITHKLAKEIVAMHTDEKPDPEPRTLIDASRRLLRSLKDILEDWPKGELEAHTLGNLLKTWGDEIKKYGTLPNVLR